MDIGAKIKDARIKAGLTQEQTAEALGVSRQTISNWENEKTYPDIVSVVKMSDLYDVSLDRLLKGEQEMSGYLDYLDESTNVVKSKEKIAKLILIMAYLVIWSISLIIYWSTKGSMIGFDYYLLSFYLLLPIATFVVSFLIGINGYWGKWKWIASFVFGIMFMLGDYVTRVIGYMVHSHKWALPNFEMGPAGMIVSLAGLGMGVIIKCLFKYLKSKFSRHKA